MYPRDLPNLNFSREVFCQHDLTYLRLDSEEASRTKLKVLGAHAEGIYCISVDELSGFFEDDKKIIKNHITHTYQKIAWNWSLQKSVTFGTDAYFFH